MLKEIPSEPLTHLLASVHQDDWRSRSFPGLPSLNDIGNVIELRGAPSLGKTYFLYYLLIVCIIPDRYQAAALRGWGKIAIVLDMDGSFDIPRFDQLLRSYLLRLFPSDVQAASLIAQHSLKKLHIFRPECSSQLAVTILRIARIPGGDLPRTEVGIIALDSLGANYWQDCFTQESTSTTSHHISAAIHLLRQSYGSLTVVTSSFTSPLVQAFSKKMPPFMDTFNCVGRSSESFIRSLGPAASITVSEKDKIYHGLLQAPSFPDVEFTFQILPGNGDLVFIEFRKD